MSIAGTYQHKRNTAAVWTSTNPVLMAGEIGLETDTLKLKAGDGTTAWTSLSYLNGTALGTLLASNNLSDLGSAATARTNLGLGSAATANTSAFDAAGAATAAVTTHVAAANPHTQYPLIANNLSDLANAATARANLGLGTAATQASTAFDTAGAATSAVAVHVALSNPHTQYLQSTTASTTYAPLASPTLTGVPLAPTATSGTNTTQIATTAFVTTAVAGVTVPVTSVAGRTGAVTITAPDVGAGTFTGAFTYASAPTLNVGMNIADSGSSRKGSVTYWDGAGGLQVGRSDHSTQFLVVPNSGGVLLYASTGSTLGIRQSNGFVLETANGGGTQPFDLGRRSDNSSGCGAYFRVAPTTTQTQSPIQIMAAGWGSIVAEWLVGGGIRLGSMSDASSPISSMYFSTTANKPVYKDAGGTVNNLY